LKAHIASTALYGATLLQCEASKPAEQINALRCIPLELFVASFALSILALLLLIVTGLLIVVFLSLVL
jgi:hypothetical protein